MTEIHQQQSNFSHKSKLSKTKDKLLDWKRPSQTLLFIVALGLLISGTCDTLIAKLMNKQALPPCAGCNVRNFEGPLWQTFISYILESAALLAYLYDRHKAKKNNTKFHHEYIHLHTTAASFVKPTCPFWWWALPSFLDFVTSMGVNFSFVFLHASTAQLLRNFNIIATAVLSLLWVRVALRRHQIMGVIIVTIGLAVVGVQEFLTPDLNTNYDATYLGVIFALGGTLANAFQVVIEERFFRDYHVSPCEALGYFGLFGLLYCIIAFIIIEFINYDGEKLSRTIYMLGTRNTEGNILLLTTIIMIFSVATFNLTGMTVTKLGSCLLRMIVISARTITIWIVELIVGWNHFGGWSFSGLVITILGVLFYNYDYLVKKDKYLFDSYIRKPLVWFKFLKDPDDLEAEQQSLAHAFTKPEMIAKNKSVEAL